MYKSLLSFLCLFWFSHAFSFTPCDTPILRGTFAEEKLLKYSLGLTTLSTILVSTESESDSRGRENSKKFFIYPGAVLGLTALFLYMPSQRCPVVGVEEYQKLLKEKKQLQSENKELPRRLKFLKEIPTKDEIRLKIENNREQNKRFYRIVASVNFAIQGGLSVTSENDTNKIIAGLSALGTAAMYFFDIDRINGDKPPRGYNLNVLPGKVGTSYVPTLQFFASF